jgi:chromosomal replication initiation ATPase DnaA
MGRDDFLVTPSNEAAVAMVDAWPHWAAHAAVLTGPKAAGKSHLVEVWRQRSGAAFIAARDLQVDEVPQLLGQGALAVEDISPQSFDETALFHVLNQARQTGGHVLLTAENWPLQAVKLPDLLSRLLALPVATIYAPDDVLLRGVLLKHFNDRQIAVDEALLTYLVQRMPRSLDVARSLVERIDAVSLERRVEVTRQLAGQVLSELASPDLL